MVESSTEWFSQFGALIAIALAFAFALMLIFLDEVPSMLRRISKAMKEITEPPPNPDPAALTPYSRMAVGIYIAVTFLACFVTSAGLSFGWIRESPPTLAIIMILFFGGWSAFALAANDTALYIGSLLLALVALLFFGVVQYNSNQIFWLIVWLTIARVLAAWSPAGFTLRGIAEVIFVLFSITTSYMLIASIVSPPLYDLISRDLSYLPLLDFRILLTLLFFAVAIVSGVQSAFIKAFALAFPDFFRLPEIAMTYDGSLVRAILSPFAIISKSLWWTFCIVINLIIKVIQYTWLFFVELGREVAVFVKSVLWQTALIWHIVKTLLTSAIFGTAAFLCIILAPRVQFAALSPLRWQDLWLNASIWTNVGANYAWIAGGCLSACLLIGLLVFIWQSRTRPLDRAVAAGVMIFICAWASAVVYLALNINFGWQKANFQTIGPFTGLGLIMCAIGVFAGFIMKPPK